MRNTSLGWVGPIVVAVLGAAACSSSATVTRSEGVETVPDAPLDHFVATTDEGLVLMDELGQQEALLTALDDPHLQWCAVDNRAQVVWWLDGETLYGLDLLAPESGPVVVLSAIPANTSHVVIDYGDEQLNRVEDHLFDLAAVVHLSDVPDVQSDIGCSGDMSWYCYENDDEGGLTETLNTELAASRDALDALEVQNNATVTGWAQRAVGHHLWMAAPASAAVGPVVIQSEPCTEVDGCGEATVLPGTAYWGVLVGNDRGDFYHESWALYDPARQQFECLSDASVTSPQPLDYDVCQEPMVPGDSWIAPGGRALASTQAVYVLGAGPVFAEDTAVCGWVGGSYPYSYQW